MDADRFVALIRALPTAGFRRRTVGTALGALGLGALAALGLSGNAAGGGGKRRNLGGSRQRQRGEPAGTEARKKKKKKSKRGPAGPSGSVGPTGPTGPAGAIDALSTIDIFATAVLGPNLSETKTVTAECPSVTGKVLGGGFDTGGSGGLTNEVTMNAAFRTERDGAAPEGFRVVFTRTATATGNDITVTAIAKCTL